MSPDIALSLDEDLSDAALRALIAADEDFEGSDADTEALEGSQTGLAECATAPSE